MISPEKMTKHPGLKIKNFHLSIVKLVYHISVCTAKGIAYAHTMYERTNCSFYDNDT